MEGRREGDEQAHLFLPYLHCVPESPRANAGKAQHEQASQQGRVPKVICKLIRVQM
jgi:hypothetical protein